MKTLQNDFTTPKQSKKLLELGLPQNSANMILDGYIDSANRWVPDPYPRYLEHPYSIEIKNESELYTSNVLPCWSVGRLIEIYLTCALECHPYDDFYTETPSLHFMAFDKDRLIEEIIEIMSEDEMDFSKLEE